MRLQAVESNVPCQHAALKENPFAGEGGARDRNGEGVEGWLVRSHDLTHTVENAPVIYSKEASEPLPPYLTKTSIVCHSPPFRPLSLPPSLLLPPSPPPPPPSAAVSRSTAVIISEEPLTLH